MFDDNYTIEKEYLKQKNEFNNTKVHIIFNQNQNSEVQIDMLLQCLQFGYCKNDRNILNIFAEDDDVDQNEIIVDESKTGKTIHTLILEATKQNLTNKELSLLSKFTQFCPNLVCLHIILDKNSSISHENTVELWTNISTHFNKLREIKFNMKYINIYPVTILEIVKYVSKIINLLSLELNFEFCELTVEDWKQLYSQLRKIKKLNTLILSAPYAYQTVKHEQKQIANIQHKKLIRLVNKNISIAPTGFGDHDQFIPEEEEDDIDNLFWFD